MLNPYFKSSDKNFYLLHGDSFELLEKFEHKFDMVFADPPYFLSNGGLSIQSGKIVSVNKGKWDASEGYEFVNDFNRKWLALVRDKMKDDATIWISGTMHNIFSVGQLLTELGFKILNVITWEKKNPPPNFSCRYFTYSTEQIIWARKSKKTPHYYNYELMKKLNGGKQMKDVWTLPAIAPWEKSCGKHPTQKPLSVLTRLILASTKQNAWILDPFTGSSTTGIAANLANRRFLGIDQEVDFLEISKNRKLEIENLSIAASYCKKIAGFINNKQLKSELNIEKSDKDIKIVLGFCKTTKLKTMQKHNIFNFDAIVNKNRILDFPTDIMNADILILFSGGRSKPYILSGYHGNIVDIKLKPASERGSSSISKAEYYYEVKFEGPLAYSADLNFQFDPKKLFSSGDDINQKLFKKFLPSITTFEKLRNARIS